MKIDIIPMSKRTVDGKWVPEARIRVYDGGSIRDRQVLDGQGRLFDSEAEANAAADATAKVFLKENPAG